MKPPARDGWKAAVPTPAEVGGSGAAVDVPPEHRPQGDHDHAVLRASGLRFDQSAGRRPVPALVAAAPPEVDVAEIARVAEDHAPEGGYGETAWHAADRIVFWIPADWTSNEEVDDAISDFMAVEGVEGVEAEAEAALPEGWEVVWTPSADAPAESAAERWDRLAREVEDDEVEDDVAVVATGQGRDSYGTLAMLRFAADEVDAARARELEALASHRASEQTVVRDTLRTLRKLAERPAGDTHVTVPTEIHPHVTIHEPDITVEPSPAPDVSVSVEPPQVTVEPPQVTVEAAPAPNVTVEVPPAPNVAVEPPQVNVTVEVPAPEPRPRAIRAVKNDADGSMTFEAVDDEEDDRTHDRE